VNVCRLPRDLFLKLFCFFLAVFVASVSGSFFFTVGAGAGAGAGAVTIGKNLALCVACSAAKPVGGLPKTTFIGPTGPPDLPG